MTKFLIEANYTISNISSMDGLELSKKAVSIARETGCSMNAPLEFSSSDRTKRRLTLSVKTESEELSIDKVSKFDALLKEFLKKSFPDSRLI